MSYKNKSKEELLLDVYRLEVTVNKQKERIVKLDEFIVELERVVEDFKKANFFKKIGMVSGLIGRIVELIKLYRDDNRTTDKPA